MSHVKIHFRLEVDEDGWPPVGAESLWAVPCEGGFRIDGIPFFVRDATDGDVVEAVPDANDSALDFTRVVRRSTSSLLRVACYTDDVHEDVRARLTQLGCACEYFERFRMVSVSVPSTTRIGDVRELLGTGSAEGLWDYEEPILRGAHAE